MQRRWEKNFSCFACSIGDTWDLIFAVGSALGEEYSTTTALQLWVLSLAADQAPGKRAGFWHGATLLLGTQEDVASWGLEVCFAEMCWEATWWSFLPFASLSPFLVHLPQNLTHALHWKPTAPCNPSVISLCLALVHLCQIPPAGLLHHPASPFNPVFLPDNQSPPYSLTVFCPKPPCSRLPPSLSPTPRSPSPAFQPAGFFHTLPSALQWLLEEHRLFFFFFSVHILTAVMALSDWDQYFKRKPY